MNDKPSYTSMSDYQRATLTAMGITAWRQNKSSENPVETPSLSSRAKKQTTQQRVEASSVELEQATLLRQSLPEHVLFPQHLGSHPLFTDILTAMDLQGKPRKALVDSDIEQYSDYILAWHIADKIDLHGSILTTPDLPSLSCAVTKKQLWQALQAYKHDNSTV